MPKKKKKSEMTGDEIELAFQKWCALGKSIRTEREIILSWIRFN